MESMESGISSLNRIKQTRDRFLARHKLSREIFNGTIAKTNEIKQYHEDIASNKHLLQKKKCTISILEMRNRMLNERITTLETSLKEKKQCVAEQEDLLKKGHQDILSARSSYCDRIYECISEAQSKPVSSICSKENNSKEFDELDTHLRNYENELRALDEHILEKELALKEIQAMGNFQQEELLKYQQLLENRKDTLKNLMQQVKLLKFNQRRNELNHTIESLYQQNNRNFSLGENNQEGETSNYFTNSTAVDNLEQFDSLNKVKNLRAMKNRESNFKSSVRDVNQALVPNEEEFRENTTKRCKISEEMFASANRTSSVEDSCKIKAIHKSTENNRRKFTPKKPIFSQKLI